MANQRADTRCPIWGSHCCTGLVPVRGRCRETPAAEALKLPDVGLYVGYSSP